jgi:CTP:molybdopterin cytidylyltransferase MocA
VTTIAGAVLAAGSGSRYAGTTPKQVAELHGRALVAWALAAQVEAGLDPVLVVVGDCGDAIVKAVPPGVVEVRAREWRRGISRSLRAALDALESRTQASAVCIGLADQPLIGADAYRRLAAAHARGALLVVATYGGRRANPVLIGRDLWPEARALDGDAGARQLMDRHEVVEVDCTSTGDPRDVDTLDDLLAIRGEPVGGHGPDLRPETSGEPGEPGPPGESSKP